MQKRSENQQEHQHLPSLKFLTTALRLWKSSVHPKWRHNYGTKWSGIQDNQEDPIRWESNLSPKRQMLFRFPSLQQRRKILAHTRFIRIWTSLSKAKSKHEKDWNYRVFTSFGKVGVIKKFQLRGTSINWQCEGISIQAHFIVRILEPHQQWPQKNNPGRLQGKTGLLVLLEWYQCNINGGSLVSEHTGTNPKWAQGSASRPIGQRNLVRIKD